MPNPAEVAKLAVAGTEFEDWETVWVQHRWAEAWPLFRFTAAEGTTPSYWTALQFKPGDICTVLLGGQLAITGIILTRQASYDATNHVVELSGAGKTWSASTSSIVSKNANFDNMAIKQIADKATAPFGVSVQQVGSVDSTPFDKCQAHPGELVFDFLDKLARHRGAVLGSDNLGNFLLIGNHSYPVTAQLVEGQNIKKMQCIISNEMMSTDYSALGQPANASQMGAGDANFESHVGGTLKNFYKEIQVVIEQPVKSKAEVDARASYEARFREGTIIKAYVTVQGWMRSPGNLWRAGDDVMVNAPMAMLNSMAMKIQTVTFQQDSQSGTTTVLELVLPWLLADQPYGTGVMSQGPNVPPPPGPAH